MQSRFVVLARGRLNWYRWDVKAREAIDEHDAEVEEALKASLAFNVA